MATSKKDKKVKPKAKNKSSGWTLNSRNLQVLSKDKLSKLSLCGNLHDITIRNLDLAIPSNPPKGSIILPIAVISVGITITLPREVCWIIKSMKISPAQ